jgi:hypothetical protein
VTVPAGGAKATRLHPAGTLDLLPVPKLHTMSCVVPDFVRAAVRDLTGPAPVWLPTAGGRSGAGTACTSGPAGVFVKWADPGDDVVAGQLAAEAAALRAVAGVPRVPELLHHDPGVPVLVTTRAMPLRRRRWAEQDWWMAQQTMAALQHRMVPGVPSVQSWRAFRDRGPDLPDVVARRLGRHTGVLVAGYERMRTWSATGAVTCHADTHPGNWVLTAAGPYLVDFGSVATGPAGFDAAFLAAHLAGDPLQRLERLRRSGADRELVAVVAAACAVRLAVGLGDRRADWRDWCRRYWPAVFTFARVAAFPRRI